MKNTWLKIDKRKLPPLPAKIASGRYTEKDIDAWMRSLGAEPIPPKEAARLRKKGLLGMPNE
ncbi:MAG: hypothetical protein FJ403_22910 [Verrucomicrobia bacterium]|nr:hypothetical protein [Verrucomicrobiota bacterium]